MTYPSVVLAKLIEPAALERAGNRDVPILSMTMHEGLVDQAAKFKKRVASADTENYKLVRRDQLVVGFPIDEGVLSIQDLYDEAMVSPAYSIWNIRDRTAIDPDYLERFLRSGRALAFYRAKLRGTTARRRNLPNDVFLKLTVPLPPLVEQRRLSRVLDQGDALVAKRRDASILVDTLIQSIFQRAFGDPHTNPKNWPRSTVGEIADQVTDGEHLTPRRVASGIKLLSARNVREGYLDFENVDYIDLEEYKRISRRCDPTIGDVLISCSGTIGRVACVETTEKFSLVRSAALVRPRKDTVHHKFLEHYLRTPALKAEMLRRANASSQANLFQAQIRELPVYLPPLTEQATFVGRATEVGNLTKRMSISLTEMKAFLASLQERVFAGGG
jgi:type I restriction enzyme S subunit